MPRAQEYPLKLRTRKYCPVPRPSKRLHNVLSLYTKRQRGRMIRRAWVFLLLERYVNAPGARSGAPLYYGLYRYVRPQTVRIFSCFGQK